MTTQSVALTEITTKIAKCIQLLDGSLVNDSFRPRMVEIIRILKSYYAKGSRAGWGGLFQIGLQIAIFRQFKKEIQDHLKIRAQGENLLAYASGSWLADTSASKLSLILVLRQPSASSANSKMKSRIIWRHEPDGRACCRVFRCRLWSLETGTRKRRIRVKLG